MNTDLSKPLVAIACGGTGGHLFPGVAVAEALRQRGCRPHLLISPKEVDQTAVKTASGMDFSTIPAVGLQGNRIAFFAGCLKSLRISRSLFKKLKPDAVLAMGGFTSAPPVLAGKSLRLPCFIHESNTIPGRANRWLSRMVDAAFVGFPEAGNRLHSRYIVQTGTPVRPEFQRGEVIAAKKKLGFAPDKPVLLVTGGSQGASGLNQVVAACLPHLSRMFPSLQILHLSGSNDADNVRQAYVSNNLQAIVHPFFADMPLALNAADLCISRAGASSIAEIAAMLVPAILVPLPTSMENHQFFNARALEQTGAAVLMEQKACSPGALASKTVELLTKAKKSAMLDALAQWHFPHAADQIADGILQAIRNRRAEAGNQFSTKTNTLRNRQTAIT